MSEQQQDPRTIKKHFWLFHQILQVVNKQTNTLTQYSKNVVVITDVKAIGHRHISMANHRAISYFFEDLSQGGSTPEEIQENIQVTGVVNANVSYLGEQSQEEFEAELKLVASNHELVN